MKADLTPLEQLSNAMQKSGPDQWVRLATDDEIQALAPASLALPFGKITAIVDDYSFVTIADRGTVKTHLMGNVVGTTLTRVTSPLLLVTRKTGLVLTATGSIYQLGTPHAGELEIQQVYALAKSINAWRASAFRALDLLDWLHDAGDADTRH